MKLKFINLLLASTLLVGAAQVFTSCKDNENDLWSDLDDRIDNNEAILGQLTDPTTGLQAQIDGLKKDRDNLTDSLTSLDGTLSGRIDALQDLINQTGGATSSDIQNLQNEINGLRTDISTQSGNLVDITTDITNLQQALDDLNWVRDSIDNLNLALRTVQTTLNSLNTKVNGLEAFKTQWNDTLPKIAQNAVDALVLARANENRILALENLADSLATKQELTNVQTALQGQIDGIKTQLAGKADTTDLINLAATLRQEAQTNLNAAKAYADGIKTQLESKISANTIAIQTVSNAIAAVQQGLQDLQARLSGIVVHQAVCPFFGTFNLPVGVANKMMVAYVGDLDHPVYFPAVDGITPLYESTGYVTEDEMQLLGITPQKENSGKIAQRGYNNEIALGSVYLTLNPNNVNYKNYNYAVVNSRGEDSKIRLTLTPSDRELTLGYARGEANGFYNASATVADANEGALRFSLSENFKSEVKDVLKHVRDNANVKTVAKLAGMAVKEVNGVLPALAIQASWDESTGANSVNSEYNLGITTINPPSFSLVSKLDGKLPQIADRVLNRIPDLGSIPDKFNTWFDELTGKIKIDILPEGYEFSVGHIDINLSDVSVAISIGDIHVTVPNPEIDVQVPEYTLTIVADVYDAEHNYVGTAEVTKTLVFDPVHVQVPIQESIDSMTAQMTSQLSDMLNDALNEEFDKLLQNLGGQMEDELNAAMQKVSDSVNELFSDMNNNINTQIEDILADIQEEISGKLESVTDRLSGLSDRFESLLHKVDKVLSQPLHYVEPVLFYKNGSKIGIMSANAGSPTLMTLNGGNAVTLLATTYTLETAVPCYKKYVAAVNAYANGDASKTTVKSVMDKVNNQTVNGVHVFNAPFSGARFTLPLVLTKGYTYELVYQAMDYSGNVMGRRFYICVK